MDSLSRMADKFNLWLFTSGVETVQEVKKKWLKCKDEYVDEVLKEFKIDKKEKK